MRRIAQRLTAPIALLVVIGLAGGLSAQNPPFFYADGQKIELRMSSRYAAVQLKSGVDLVRPEDFGLEAKYSAGNVPLLRENRIVLIKKELASFGEKWFKDLTEREPSVERSVPVYELDGVDLVQPSQVVVKVRSEEWRGRVEAQLRALGTVRKEKDGHYLVSVPESSSLDIANALAISPGVQFAEPNFTVISAFAPAGPPYTPAGAPPSRISASSNFPNDWYFNFQWGLQNDGATGKRGADIEAPPAWSAIRADPTAKTDAITIAILDVGVDTQQPDLKDKIVKPYDATTKGKTPQDPYPWDVHGTACAGVAAAVTDNALGIAGLSLNARIMPIRIATTQKPQNPGDVQPWIYSWDAVADGIETAIDQGADVLSNSWGGGYSSVVNDAIDYALKNGRKGLGAVVVFAAGNEGSPVSWPANLSLRKTLIAVSATNEWDELKTTKSRDGEKFWGSNFGPEVTVAAPGVHIYTTTIHVPARKPQDDFISDFRGTSSAAPLVAGLAALILSQHPNWTAGQIRDQIDKTADQLGVKPRNDFFGFGRINACRAIGGQCRATNTSRAGGQPVSHQNKARP